MSESDERHLEDQFGRGDEPDVEGHVHDVSRSDDADEEPDVQAHRQGEFMRHEDVAEERHLHDENQ